MDGKPMTALDYITILGGTAWAIILIARQTAAYRSVIRSHSTHDDNQKANP